MSHYSPQERSQIIELYFKSNESPIKTQRLYCKLNKTKTPPTTKTINRFVKDFKDGNLTGHMKGRCGTTRTVRTEAKVEEVKKVFKENPNLSARKAAALVGMSDRSIRRSLKEIAKHPPETGRSPAAEAKRGEQSCEEISN